MSLKLWPSRPMPIGIDIGARNLRLLQLAPTGGLKVQAAAHYEFAPDVPVEGPERTAVLIEALRQALAAAPFTGRDAVVCLPDSIVQFKNVRLPRMPADELRQALEWEAAERFGLAGQPATFQHLVIGDVQQGEETRQEVLLMAAADNRLEAVVGALQEVGLRPLALEATPIALARAAARTLRREADLQTVRLFVDFGYRATKALIVRGHQVVFYRQVELGGAALDAALSERLKISAVDAAALRRRRADLTPDESRKLFSAARREDAEQAIADTLRPVLHEIAKEIGLCLRYYGVTFRGQRPDKLLACGGEARDAQSLQAIAQNLELAAEPVEPLAGVDVSSSQLMIDRRGTLPEWTLAMGAAIRDRAAARQPARGAA